MSLRARVSSDPTKSEHDPVPFLRCSYGAPHSHDAPNGNDDWAPDRNLGIAAQGRKSVEKLLRDWQNGGDGRWVEGIETRECGIPERVDGQVWWREPEAEQET